MIDLKEIWKKAVTFFNESHPMVKSVITATGVVAAIAILIGLLALIVASPLPVKIICGIVLIIGFIATFFYCEIFG
jgi:hypothetical protein